MPASHSFFATCAPNTEQLLIHELTTMGIDQVKGTRAGVAFQGSLSDGYRACLWSRLASRVLLPLSTFFCPSQEALYEGVQKIPWAEHMAEDGTLAVDFNSIQSQLDHSHFGALKVKDAIVDQFRDAVGERPDVDTKNPDLRINLLLLKDQATVSIDLSGGSLHRRGYRQKGGRAPLKETLAAAILYYAHWRQIANDGGQLVDLMCGSGTLLIEGAMMAGDIAPGLGRGRFGFHGWRGHNEAVWDDLYDEARQRQADGMEKMPPIHGFDRDERAITSLNENLWNAGLENKVTGTCRGVRNSQPMDGSPGLVVVNPPYGERLAQESGIPELYTDLGEALKSCFVGWKAAVFTGNQEMARYMRLGAERKNKMNNGTIPCQLLHYTIDADRQRDS